MILGRRHGELPRETRELARSLDQLYGSGDGEGSGADAATGGGRGAAYPSARHWGDALAEFFGDDVRSDIVAAALEAGDPRGIELLDEESARPSTELLTTVLAMAGALPEHTLTRLRPLLRRMVHELARVLAMKLRPALRGMTSTRPTLRDTGRLDAPATIRRNLRHTVRTVDGRHQIIAATPIFRQRLAKHAEWHVIVVVDTSGSMGASTVYAALTAAIFAGVPVLEVTFLAFSTEVVDLSDHVDDPLALLLEVSVGGGTDIARAVRMARTQVRVPSRTMVVLITDFEEGGSPHDLVAQIGALHDSGVKLLGCAALDDAGQARYNVAIAGQVAAAGMAVSALSPTQLARWVHEQVSS